MSGKLIVFEGAEGVGKSTQVRFLAEWLESRGQDVVAVREPGGTILGDEIRRLLLDPATVTDIAPRAEALLFMASRAQLVERELKPALAQNVVVLVDRFFLSTYAYQCAGRGLAQEEVRNANRLATAGLVPDVTFLLVLPVAEGLARAGKRGSFDKIERAAGDFHERVASAFTQFATAEWQRAHPECGPIVSIDARGTERDVFARITDELTRRWPGSSFGGDTDARVT